MIRIYDDAAALAAGAAESVVGWATEALAARGRFRLGLPGGRTPRALFELLASDSFRERIDWSHCIVGFADERAVPRDHPDSNFGLAATTLIEPAGIPAANVLPMEADTQDLEAAAARYDLLLAEPFDLLLLGIGEDGHTASLFPGSPLLDDTERRVAVVTNSPKPPSRRMTVTPRVLAEAHRIMVLASGGAKAHAVMRALEGDTRPSEVPARLLRDRGWYLDRAAASRLSE